VKLFFKTLFLIIAVACLIYVFFYFTDILLAPASKPDTQPQVCFKEHCFFVELAKTEEARAQGLMFRKSLDKDQGMLFIFNQEGIYPFWMKNTLIPLDIIWLNKDSKVVFISKSTQPCLSAQAGAKSFCPGINPEVNAQFVLEINAGVSDELGLNVGDGLDMAFCDIMN